MAPTHDFKKTGLLRAGFQYQDLVAIEILLDFYRDHSLYLWVELESEDHSFRSIEDIVACRPDGLYELIQVKFTADPDASANSLSWDWLTANSYVGSPSQQVSKRTSLLQKWAHTTLFHIANGTLASAALKTDRIPNSEFSACLEDRKINYKLLSPEMKERIVEHIGSPEKVQAFFEVFEFIHSQPRLDDFEERLQSRLSADTDEGGWALFRQQVQQWSTRKGQPPPDGKINYIHLRQAFSGKRSKPLPQDFFVPESYSVPDVQFDKAFASEALNSDGITVLWGPPGRGKSTYLSHIASHVDPKDAVCIRHHYFLSLNDPSEGRFNFHSITHSLKNQLQRGIPEFDASKLSIAEAIREASKLIEKEQRRLIVIIDGLDHVWRDHRDHEDMEMLFEALLPQAANVRIIIGTQKISKAHLPQRLLNALPQKDWTELPLMSRESVYNWLSSQDEDGRLNLFEDEKQNRAQSVRAVSDALHTVSGGLPLHLIYSFEALARSGKQITVDDVMSLPDCPTGDIRDYYRSMWERIGEKARSILHVLAGLEFGLPSFGLSQCFGNGRESLEALAEINHLLYFRELEVKPFHGSLFAFIRDLTEHKQIFVANAEEVIEWLETDAPEYWRWAWLSVTRSQLGDHTGLLAEPSRKWAIQSLVNGYPIEQLINILDRAEHVALDRVDLPRLLTLRCVKERAWSGPEFQTDEWHLFQEVASSISKDPHVKLLLGMELTQVEDRLLPFIIRSTTELNRAPIVRDVISEVNRRLKHKWEAQSSDRPDDDYLYDSAASVLAHNSCLGTQRVERFADQFEHPEELLTSYARESLLVSNFDNVFSVADRWSSFDLDREVLVALCLEGLSPCTKPQLKAMKHPAVHCLAIAKSGLGEAVPPKKDLSHLYSENPRSNPELSYAIRQGVYETFFVALGAGLSGTDVIGMLNIPIDCQDSWLSGAFYALVTTATAVASDYTANQRWPSLKDLYSKFRCEPPMSESYEDSTHFNAFRRGLNEIAVDICTIAVGIDANDLIDATDIDEAADSPFWSESIWLNAFVERRLPLHSQDAARRFLLCVASRLDSDVTEFAERTSTAVRLALFASDHGLNSIARKELARAVGCLLGYGWRKDAFAFEVLASLGQLSNSNDSDVLDAILGLAGEVEAITDYTDGDGTRFVPEEYYSVIAMCFPERVASCYAFLIGKEEWRNAERLAIDFAKSDASKGREGYALLETYIAPSEVQALEDFMSPSRPDIKAAVSALRRKTGKPNTSKPDEQTESSAGTDHFEVLNFQSNYPGATIPSPEEFPPGELEGYLQALDALHSYELTSNLVNEWLCYWMAQDLIHEALSDLESTASSTRYSIHLGTVLDLAFEIVLKTQGRSQAFPWLVRAHVHNYGWDRWMTSNEEVEARIQQIASNYRNRWQDFIKKSVTPRYARRAQRNGITVGKSRLVYFLNEIGQVNLAKACALEMARIFKDELAEQPIKSPEWSS